MTLPRADTIMDESRNGFNVTIDAEVLRSVLDLRFGLFSSFEAGVELPFLYSSAGVLDGLIGAIEGSRGVERVSRERKKRLRV